MGECLFIWKMNENTLSKCVKVDWKHLFGAW